MKKLLTIIMILSLLFTSVSVPQSAYAATKYAYGKTITELMVDSNMVYVYYPTPNAQDTSKVSLSCTAPAYIVFGNGAMQKDECIKYAKNSGLAELAAKNGSSILFVQPIEKDWTEKDATIYQKVVTKMNDSSFIKTKNGIGFSVDFITQKPSNEKVISGTQQRIYVYGLGSGANMIANNWLRTCENASPWGGSMDVTMASATLEKLSDVSGLKENDIPTVSINNSKSINKKLKAKNSNHTFMTDTGENLIDQSAKLTGAFRRQSTVLLPIHNYKSEGITEKVETVTVNRSKDNTYTNASKVKVNYVTYYSKDMDLTAANKVPLVMLFHGSGNTAKYQAMASEWPNIAKKEGLIIVSVDLHYPKNTPTEIVELIHKLELKYPCIDTTRIYASGFSIGSTKTLDLFQQFPEVFAGVAPMSGYFNMYTDYDNKVTLPIFYVAGENTPLPEFPSDMIDQTGAIGNNMNKILGYVLKSNDVTDNYSYNSDNKLFGIKPDYTYTVSDKRDFQNSILKVNLYKSKNGKYYTAFANSSNQGHEVFARNSWAAWDFLKQFSRKANGEITIKK